MEKRSYDLAIIMKKWNNEVLQSFDCFMQFDEFDKYIEVISMKQLEKFNL